MSCPKPLSSILKQDYEKLKQESLQKKRPFTDELFKANDASIGDIWKDKDGIQYGPKGTVWMRPKDICTHPKFIQDGMTLPDVCQQKLADCWFLAAVAPLTLHPELLKRVVPQDQTFDDDAGIFRFRFWQLGQWVEVVVDDWLPTENGKLIFARSTKKEEFWVSLLEKAYAKLNGCYGAIVGGFMKNALVDLTGGIGESVRQRCCDPYFDLCKIIKKALDTNSLMGASIQAPKDITPVLKQLHWLPIARQAEFKDAYDSTLQLKGLLKYHAYSVTGFQKIPVEGKKEKLLRLRNPWGRNGEWTGDWSDNDSQNWSKLDPDLRAELFVKENDGEFWMKEDDFCTRFDCLNICHLSADAPNEGGKSFCWESSCFRGCLLKHQSPDIPWMNPQFHVKLLEPDEGSSTCTLLVSLMQKDQHRSGKEFLEIGFAVDEVTEEYVNLKDPAERKELLSELSNLQNPIATVEEEELTRRFELPCGDYLIIPMNLSSEGDTDFLLRIFTVKKHHSSAVIMSESTGVPDPAESEENCD